MEYAARDILHTPKNKKRFLCDLRGGVTKKFYLQCLLDLERNLQLTTMLPAYEPQSYYRCLLSGISAEPGLGEKAYLRMLKGESPLEPLCDESVPALPPRRESEVMFAVEPPPKPKPATPSRPPIVEEPLALPLADTERPSPKRRGRPAPKAKSTASGPSSVACLVASVRK